MHTRHNVNVIVILLCFVNNLLSAILKKKQKIKKNKFGNSKTLQSELVSIYHLCDPGIVS